MDFSTVFLILNWGTVGVAVILGLVCGRLFYAGPRNVWQRITSLYFIGLTYFTSLGVVRALEGAPGAPAWIGQALIWTIFVGFIGVNAAFSELKSRRK